MTGKKKWIIFAVMVLVFLLGIGSFAFFGYLRPHMLAANTMNEGMMELSYQVDGSIILTWPEAENADGYEIRVLEPAAAPEGDPSGTIPAAEEILHVWTEGNQYILKDIPLDRELEIRVGSYCNYTVPFSEENRKRAGTEDLAISGVFQPPGICDLVWNIDENTDELTVEFGLPENGICRVYHGTGGEMEQIDRLTVGKTVIRFGGDGSFPVPDHEQKHVFAFDVVCTYDSYVYTGTITEEIVITREGFLGTNLNTQWTDEGNNVYSVTWDETKGEYYAVQRYDETTEEWIDVYTAEQDEERFYSTGHLPRYSDFTYRVVAVGGDTLPDSIYAAVSEEYPVTTSASVVFSTIWPIQDLKVYTDPAQTSTLGTAPEGEAYCILDVEDDFFRIRFGEGYGYIDSRYCMINLPEMIGSLCSYDIANSYSSRYKVHDFDLPNVTGKVIGGYESVKQNGGSYLVPLLYPVALKLEAAAFAAREEGYRLKIYDSFRPQEATSFLYDKASGIAGDPIPGQETQADQETTPEQKPVTYQMFMTDNGRYSLNYFLAKGTSRHNQGIAMDLTMEKLSDGTEVKMQTAMHDLTWYSEVNRNNANAKKLRSIMLGAGFTGLVSEWWHFQDNDAKDNLKPAHLRNGVTAECWVADDHGWRYRSAAGKYAVDTVRTIDGVEYTFDESGYVVQPKEEENNAS